MCSSWLLAQTPSAGGHWDSCYAIHYNGTPIGVETWDCNKVHLSRQAYYASVSFVDKWIGNIFKVLENRELLDNTLLFFTADHGDMMGDHYHWRKGYPYFGSASIPMLLTWPPSMDHSNGGVITTQRGTVKDEVTELRDIFPTFLDVAGLPVPDSLNGSSLLNLLKDSGDISNIPETPVKWREYVDLEHDICYNVTNHWNALTDGEFKYIFEAYFADEQLFDLRSDPQELHNLAAEKEWQSELEMWRQRLVEQFEREGRGSEWVQGGKLMKRVKGMLYSPHYPRKTTKVLPPD